MKILATSIAMLLSSLAASAAQQSPRWTTEGPRVEEAAFSFELPLEVLASKLFVEVELGGQARRFVFDTGSPSMMSSDLATELGLEVVDKRQGRDAHGAIVDTDIVQSDLNLGGTTFRKVPIFVANFPPTARCLFDGVLGSELLPLCAWQIDLPNSVLRCNTRLDELHHIDTASKVLLHDFGYPHAPIVDIRFADNAVSKALFDTGNNEYLAIAPNDFEGARRNKAVGATVRGRGSIGGSLGGVAPSKEQRLVQLKALSIGSVDLGSVVSPVRETAPSLIGASVLEHFVVTPDARTKSLYLDQYRAGPFVRMAYGLSLSFDQRPSVSLVWEGSPAEAAGIEVGQAVHTINDEPADTSCASIRSAMKALTEGDSLKLGLDGQIVTLVRESALKD